MAFRFVDADGNSIGGVSGVPDWPIYEPWFVESDPGWEGSFRIKDRPDLTFRRLSPVRWEFYNERDDRYKSTNTAGGARLTVEAHDAAGHIVETFCIDRVATALSRVEVQRLLDSLAELAIDLACGGSSNLELGTAACSGGMAAVRLTGSERMRISQADAVCRLGSTVREHWRSISSGPLTELVPRSGECRIDRLIPNGVHLITRKLRPERRVVHAMSKQDSCDTEENRFVRFLIEVLLKGFGKVLLGEISAIEQRNDSRVLPLNSADRSRRTLLAREVCGQLEKIVDWADQSLRSNFLSAVRPQFHRPVPTNRLLGTPAYRQVWRSYVQTFEGTEIERLLKALALHQRLLDGTIAGTPKLYELWALLRTLKMFFSELGMQFVGSSPLDALQVQGNRLVMPSGSTFKLSKPLVRGALSIEVGYETSVAKSAALGGGNLCPDIVIHLVQPDRKASVTCIMDAKYHEYPKLKKGPYSFAGDLLCVALGKYTLSVEQTPTLSVILHPNDCFGYLGNTPWSEHCATAGIALGCPCPKIPPSERCGACGMVDDRLSAPGHRLVSLCWKPGAEDELSAARLKGLLFHYFAPLGDICLNCGGQAGPKNMFSSTKNAQTGEWTRDSFLERSHSWPGSEPARAFGVVCDNCSSQWSISFCGGCKKRIVKAGTTGSKGEEESKWYQLHRQTDDKRGYICPSCSADPPYDRAQDNKETELPVIQEEYDPFANE